MSNCLFLFECVCSWFLFFLDSSKFCQKRTSRSVLICVLFLFAIVAFEARSFQLLVFFCSVLLVLAIFFFF
jgi:hypothetical protein